MLGVVLVLAFAGVIYGLVLRFGQSAPRPVPPAAVAAAGAAWETLRLNEPAGTQLAGTAQSGSLLSLHLYTGSPGTDARVVVVDLATGRVVGRIAVTEPR